jgi:hypothetical protein
MTGPAGHADTPGLLSDRERYREAQPMYPDESDSVFAAIDAKLASVLGSLPARPSWCERWQCLGPESTEEERLAVYRAIRDSGLLPVDAGFYLVSWQVDAIAGRLAETSLGDLDARLKALEDAHGLEEGELWEPGEAPAEYEDLLRQYQQAWDEIFADQLDAHGEPEIAALFRAERAEYERRSEAGRQFFHGPRPAGEPDDGDWLDRLLEAVEVTLEPESPMGPLALVYREEEGFWEVDAYPTPVELVGGAEDGALVSPGFSLDLERLRSAFERIDGTGWNAFGWYDGDGPFIWVEGSFQGRDVFLRVLSQAPEGEEPGAKLRIQR